MHLDQSSVGPYLVGFLYDAVLVIIAWKGFSLATAELKHDVHLIKNAVIQRNLYSGNGTSTAGLHTRTRGDE